MALPKPISYKYFYFNDNFKLVEISEKEYNEWNTNGYWISIPNK